MKDRPKDGRREVFLAALTGLIAWPHQSAPSHASDEQIADIVHAAMRFADVAERIQAGAPPYRVGRE